MPIPQDIIGYEEIMRFITNSYPKSKKDGFKPEVIHAIGTGLRLLDFGYEKDVVVAGFLHDALEEEVITPEQLEEKYGVRVLNIVEANSKDRSIKDKEEKIRDIVARCSEVGKDALVVKAADIYDNYLYFKRIGDEENVEYDRMQARILLKDLDYSDDLFGALRGIV